MYQRAIMVDPKFYKSYYNLGNIYLEDEKTVFWQLKITEKQIN